MLLQIRAFRTHFELYAAAVILVGTAAIGFAKPDSIRVRHDHDPWGACEGDLTVDREGIRYHTAEKEEHSHDWTWLDIQTVDRTSPDQFSLLTYEDQRLLLGRDRPWDFTVLGPQSEGLSDELFAVVLANTETPVVDREARPIEAQYEIPVKHLHTFGGCEGVLRLGEEWIVYVTDHRRDQRSWRKDREVANVWSTGPYDLELETYEKEGGDLLRTRRFRFQLKRRLDEGYYDQLRRAMLAPR